MVCILLTVLIEEGRRGELSCLGKCDFNVFGPSCPQAQFMSLTHLVHVLCIYNFCSYCTICLNPLPLAL